MGRNSGSIKNGSKRTQNGGGGYEYTPENTRRIASNLQEYSKVNKWRDNSSYMAGFNDAAQSVVENVAKKNLGLASTIAQRAVSSPNWNVYGYSFSDKQAYVIANAALKNKLVPKHIVFDKYEIRTKPKAERVKVQTSATSKTAVGSSVSSKKYGSGVIRRIITKSTGYVEVEYANGVKRKEMAFNLFGTDGKPLRNKPKY